MLNAEYTSAEILFCITVTTSVIKGGVRSDFTALPRVPAVILNNTVVSVCVCVSHQGRKSPSTVWQAHLRVQRGQIELEGHFEHFPVGVQQLH